jgi:hypothetical protein
MSIVERKPTQSLEEIELGPRVASALAGIGERREIKLAGFRLAGRRRRPSGTPPPLPHPLYTSGRVWLTVAALVIVVWLTIFLWPETESWWTRRDHQILRWFVDIRNDAFTAIARRTQFLLEERSIRTVRLATIAALIVFRRFRHLFVGLAAFLGFRLVIDSLISEIGRPRPYVEIIGNWVGPSHPAAMIAALTLTLVVMGYSLFPVGRWRDRWFGAATALITFLSLVEVYLGVNHVTDVVFGALFGAAVGVTTFRLFVPDQSFPVRYRSGSSAHLDITGPRGVAIKEAVRDQLGLDILSMKPVGLAGSAGSTPIRLTVAGEDGNDVYLFAKLYATSHLRSDRWYKIARHVLYGALEDEVRFTSVSRLVEYEDYLLRVMKDAGIPSAASFGIVELTPEREYLIVTEFFQGAVELGDADVNSAVIDGALRIIRLLWDANLAHRDVKPANVMVRDDEVLLIDVAFGTVRPTPWRQAVDLANMMLTLALRTDPDVVYRRALLQFSPGDIAEAFAATKGVTMPSQLRAGVRDRLREDGIDLIAEFRRLAPTREPIAIQRWNAERIRLTLAVVVGAVLLLSLTIENLRGAGFL